MQTTEELLSAKAEDQKAWIIENFPSFEERAYDDNFLGMVYFASDEEIAERVQYYEDYGTIGTLASRLDGFTEDRADEIRSGAALTPEEVLTLKAEISETDGDGWISVHGWEAATLDGIVFVVAYGCSEGQGGIRLVDPKLFRSKEDVREWIEKQEIWSD